MFILVRIVSAVFEILNLLIIGRVIISWVQPNPSDMRWQKVIKFIFDATEPILGPIRELLPSGGILGIDISPLIAIFALQIIHGFIRDILITLVI
ncbi:YggT family protein [Halanaerobium saccharolyticum]|uniref:YggT family protein n=1 Tax=Halanaerobium saccharolyticum TaxID=43595 RepID=A0A4R6LIG0_9FIRM|nr:YggT family protein [Halanaerobium saccharolyticum]TDO83427.1 YggT family protein [Halanaerobium saccharolyticum]